MKPKFPGLLVSIMIMLVGFCANPAMSFQLITYTETVTVESEEVEVIRTADNFIILYDTSESMNQPYKDTGMTMLEVEKKILKEKFANMPDLGFKSAGLYSFTPKASSMSFKALKPYYEIGPYNRTAFGKAIDSLPTKGSGPTLLQGGIAELGKLLSGLEGHTVVFIVTDGQQNMNSKMRTPVELARHLARKHDVSFCVISTAPDAKAEKILKAVASINARSRVVPFDYLLGKPARITGALYVVNKKLVSTPVDIAMVVGAKLDNVQFDFGKYTIRSEYVDRLKKLGEFMQANPDVYTILSGFADNSGDSEHNIGLSRRRAEALGSYLMDQFGIDPERIVTLWYGEADPIADNTTHEGRKLNRRVELILTRI